MNTVLSERHKCEFWVCADKGKHYNMWSSNINVYERHLHEFPESNYNSTSGIDLAGDGTNTFELAQCCRERGELHRALQLYEQYNHSEANHTVQKFYSQYQAAILKETLGKAWETVLGDYLQAYEVDPSRAEPLYRVAVHYQCAQQWASALHFFEAAIRIPKPSSAQFIDHSIYDYLLPLNYAVALYWRGRYQESLMINQGLLNMSPDLTDGLRDLVIKNIEFARMKLNS
jgi:tetratricopeptide (TPR) repeat protein